MKFRAVVVTFAALAVQSCAQPAPPAAPVAVATPAAPAPMAGAPAMVATGDMHRAAVCSFTGAFNAYGGGLTATVSSGGGWCWYNLERNGNGRQINAFTGGTISAGPQHGQAQATLLPDGRLRVAYQPVAGYVGTDTFLLTVQPRGTSATATVTVVAADGK